MTWLGPWLRLTIACVLVGLTSLSTASPAGAQSFTHSRVIERNGNPTLVVDGKPFFFYGAAFFYERIPAPRWRASMLALRALGFNTLDLYVPWNWHELADGDVDFSGRTNPQRNLRAVLALARELDFKLIVRPGPVVRNEWRNGGYPAWLLTRPEYGMPLHDVLEGRYPATATLQNANSDDAAAQWMNNATHMTYARRWLRAALHEFEPVADRVLAIALDDDQGAYIDNQTWPAPHFQAYLHALEATVRGVVGAQLPLFINTYEMKVTASAPVWAMGNWYQSDAYSIGEHDRSALEFSTGLLQTQTHDPVAISEFQAGWLAQPEDPTPRPADPTNTTLALHTLLGLGARGAIDFPAQDTINPAGWEAPFANAAYVWDAALGVDLIHSPRYAPTARFGRLIRANGEQLAGARRLADGAIAYLTSAYDERTIANADIFAIAARTQDAQHACRARHLTCDLVDLRYISDAALRRFPFVIVPQPAIGRAMIAPVIGRLARYRAAGGRVLGQPPDGISPRNGGIPDATLLLAADGMTAFLDIVNYDTVPHAVARTHLVLPHGRRWDVGPLTIPARDAVLLRSDLASARLANRTLARDERRSDMQPAPPVATPACRSMPVPLRATRTPAVVVDDRAGDGLGRVTLANALISVSLAPTAGARAFWFGERSDERCRVRDAFTSVGALRDDVEAQPPLSTTDRIGKYTRSFPAGMFNRTYRIAQKDAADDRASVTLRYTAPDVVPNGATFERTIALDRDERAFTVAERVTFEPGPNAERQRSVRYDSFDSRGATVIDERANGAIGFYFPSGAVTSVTWPVGDVEDATLIPERTSTVVRLRFAPGGLRRTRYALDGVTSLDAARSAVLRARDRVAGSPESQR